MRPPTTPPTAPAQVLCGDRTGVSFGPPIRVPAAAGTLIGGPKLTPVLSPHKTWAGAVGGVVGGLIAALLYGPLVLNRLGLQLSVLQLVTVGAVVAVSAQVGDVAESLFKREAGVKDSSSLIPGHGGVLDRLDSLYFVLPTTAGLLRLFGIA